MSDELNIQFTAAARFRSFGYALSGIRFMLRTQHNAWLHAAAIVAVITTAITLGVSAQDSRWLVAVIAIVWIAEAQNTAVEHLCDVVSPEFRTSVQRSKDIAAGAVLLSAMAAAIIGAVTFWPYLVAEFR